MKITIEIDNAESVYENLADILCFWRGFDIGLKLKDETGHEICNPAIENIRQLRIKMSDQIIRTKQTSPPNH